MIMRSIRWLSFKLSNGLEVVAGVGLILMMLLTVSDVIMRSFGSPIRGTYELIAFGGGLVMGLSQACTFRAHAHISVDTFLPYLPSSIRLVLYVLTRLMALGMFLIIGWSLIQIGADLKSTGETSAVLKLPYTPLLYAMAGAFLSIILTFIDDLRNPGEAQNG